MWLRLGPTDEQLWALMKLRVPWKMENCLTGWVSVSFSVELITCGVACHITWSMQDNCLGSTSQNIGSARHQVPTVCLSWLAMSRKLSGYKLCLNLSLETSSKKTVSKLSNYFDICWGLCHIVSLKYRPDFSHGSSACLQMEELLHPMYVISVLGNFSKMAQSTSSESCKCSGNRSKKKNSVALVR
jgi:hypothetical protein